MSETGSTISARSVSEVIEHLRATSRANEKPQLSPAALAAVAAEPPPALSPIVLAGVVRLIEFALILTVGFSIHVIYLLASEGFSWQYAAATFGIAVLSIVARSEERRVGKGCRSGWL